MEAGGTGKSHEAESGARKKTAMARVGKVSREMRGAADCLAHQKRLLQKPCEMAVNEPVSVPRSREGSSFTVLTPGGLLWQHWF